MTESRSGCRATVTRDGETVKKEYSFATASLARDAESAIETYYAELVGSGLVVAPLDGLTVEGRTLIVHQEYVDGLTPARTIDHAIRSDGFVDEEVATLCVDTFGELSRVLRTVDAVGSPADDLTTGCRFATGYDWKPSNFVRRQGVYHAFDLVYPLSLAADSGLVDTTLRDRNGDPFPPVLAYYLWYTPVGAVQNVGLSTLSLVDGRIGAEAFADLREQFDEIAGEVLAEFGYRRDWRSFFAPVGEGPTYEDVVSLYRRTGTLRIDDLFAGDGHRPV